MKIIFLIIIVFIALPTHADWTAGTNIKEIIAEGADDASAFVVVVSNSISSDSSGATCSGTYHYLNASTEKGKLMFSILLTAKTTNTPVRFILDQGGNTSRCKIVGVR